MRKMGKMSFLTIGDILGKIQISVKVDMIGEEAYQDFKANYDLGDFIGVEGELFTTHTGEKTIRASHIEFLGKALINTSICHPHAEVSRYGFLIFFSFSLLTCSCSLMMIVRRNFYFVVDL